MEHADQVRTYNILISPNAFKGSLTAIEAAQAILRGVNAAMPLTPASGAAIHVATHELPLADGGDGTLETLVAATGGYIRQEKVTGPLGRPVQAAWGHLCLRS